MSFDALTIGWSRVLGVDRKQFNMFFERMMDGFAYHKIVLDQAGKPVDYVFLEINSAFERLTGLKRENLIGKHVTEVLPGIERDPANWIGVYGKVALTGESVQFESYSASLDRWYSVSSYCPAKGYFVALFEDITNRKKVEDSLKMTLARFYNSLANMHGAVLLVSAEGKVEFANQSFCDYFLLKESPAELEGLTSDVMIEKIKGAYLHSEEQVQRIREIVVGGKPMVGEEVEMQGDRTFLRDFIPLPLDDKSFSRLWYHVDITGRKKVEEALKRSGQKYRELYGSIADMYVAVNLSYFVGELVHDKKGRPIDIIYRDANSATLELMGKTRDQVIGKTRRELFGDVEDDFLERFDKVLKTGEAKHFESYGAALKKYYDVYAWRTPEKLIGATVQDITPRKQAEEALKQSEERFRSTLDTMMEGCQIIGRDWRYIYINDAAERQNRRPKEELLGKRYMDQWPGIEQTQVFAVIRRCMEERAPQVMENFFNYPDGATGWFDLRINPVPEGVFVLSTDISERKKAEAALRASEENYRHLLQYAPTAIYEIDYNGPRFKSVNDAMCQLTGYTREELLAMSPMAMLTPESQKRFAERTKRILSGEKIDEAVEFTTVIKDGRQLNVVLYVKPSFKEGKLDGALIVGYDVTERKQMQDKLEEYAHNLEGLVEERTKQLSDERQRLYNVLETLPAYVILLDKDYKVPFANKVFRERFGEDKGRQCYDFLFNRAEPCENCETYKVLETGKPHHWEWTGPDKCNYDVYDFPFKAADGSIQILEMGLDITQRKKAEAKVLAASLYARSLLEASLDPLVTISAKGKITDVNEATVRATGCSRNELIGSDFCDYFTDSKKAREGYERVFVYEQVSNYPLTLKHKSGKTTDVLYNASIYRNERGKTQGIFAAARDVTELNTHREHLEELVKERTQALRESQEKLELKAAEVEEYATNMESLAEERARKLKDAERLAAIGATAGMVGHDIRNPLQAIIGDIYLARSDVESMPSSELKASLNESLESIQKSVDYVNKIVLDLQDYAKPLKPAIHETDLQTLIDDIIKRNGIPSNVKLTQHLTKDAQTIKTDPDILKRIIGNLVSNAIQAMSTGGKLTIKATTKKENGSVILTVKDTGTGIPEYAKVNLFTPLFTTKSKGQGFGLAVVKRMTEALGGTVTFESEEGKGAEFTVILPQ